MSLIEVFFMIFFFSIFISFQKLIDHCKLSKKLNIFYFIDLDRTMSSKSFSRQDNNVHTNSDDVLIQLNASPNNLELYEV